MRCRHFDGAEAIEWAVDEEHLEGDLGLVGIAQWSPGWSAEAILEAADRALLAAKADGGGIVAASELQLEMAR